MSKKIYTMTFYCRKEYRPKRSVPYWSSNMVWYCGTPYIFPFNLDTLHYNFSGSIGVAAILWLQVFTHDNSIDFVFLHIELLQEFSSSHLKRFGCVRVNSNHGAEVAYLTHKAISTQRCWFKEILSVWRMDVKLWGDAFRCLKQKVWTLWIKQR